MPSYNFNPYPYKPPCKVLFGNKVEYCFGSFRHTVGPTIGNIITDAVNGSNVATVVFQIQSGNVPVVGALVTILGAQNTAFAGAVVLNAVLTSVSVVMLTGVCTITFARTAALQATTSDFGQVVIPQPELGETINNGASIPVNMTFQTAENNHATAITAVVKFPVTPWACTVTLQQALDDSDTEYADVATVAIVAGGVVTGGQVTVQITVGRFYRFNVTGLNESSPAIAGTIIAKLLA